MAERRDARESLLRGQRFLAQGDYQAALKENQRVFSLSADGLPRDEALFNLGLIYAHLGNPQKDYDKSLVHFRKVLEDYPQSPFAHQAAIWLKVLEQNWRLAAENRKLSREIHNLKEVMEKSKQIDIEVEKKKREEVR